ncbi:MAG: type IV toxin-antitoxin system AbiEi family antitoxin domain-containing protein [Tetrasphaera sp.]
MEIHDLAVHGVIATRDATALGLSPSDIVRLCRQCTLRRMIRGWYAVCPPGVDPPPWEGRTPWETQCNCHTLLISALVRSFEGRVIASHHSSLLLNGGRLHGVDFATAHVARMATVFSRHRDQAVIHPKLVSADFPPVTSPSGLITVHPLLAAIQVGLIEHADRAPDPVVSLVAVDGLLHDGIVTTEAVNVALALFRNHPGIHRVKTVLQHRNGDHESVAETLLALSLRALGYSFRAQVPHTVNGVIRKVDFELIDEQVAIEFDGLEKYGGMDRAPNPAAVRLQLSREKTREDGIRAQG